MPQRTWRYSAGALTLLLVATVALAAGADGLPTNAARMYGFVKIPHRGELKWQQIPWLTDLSQAIRQARAEHRPVLLFVSGDDPLEKC